MPAQRKYPEELRERAVKMVFEVRERTGRGTGSWPGWAGSWVFTRRRCGPGSKQAEIDGGTRPGITTGDEQRIAELEREARELRRANEILKAASVYFAWELDPRYPR